MKKVIYKNLSSVLTLLLIFSSIAPVFAQRKQNISAANKKQIAKLPVVKEEAEMCEIWAGTIQYTQRRAETTTKVTNKGEHPTDQHNSGTQVIKQTYDYNGNINVVNSSRGGTYEDGSKSFTLKGIIGADVTRVMDEKHDWKTETDCFPDTPRIRVAGQNSASTSRKRKTRQNKRRRRNEH
jgi:hypothetical protein